MKRKWRKLYNEFISLAGPSEHIARSFAVGSFIGFCPAIGTHSLLCLAAAALFRLNITAMYLATWVICNPLTGPLVMLGEYELGRYILRWPYAILPTGRWTFSTLMTLGWEVLVPLAAGWVTGGMVLSLAAYPGARRLILRVRGQFEK